MGTGRGLDAPSPHLRPGSWTCGGRNRGHRPATCSNGKCVLHQKLQSQKPSYTLDLLLSRTEKSAPFGIKRSFSNNLKFTD